MNHDSDKKGMKLKKGYKQSEVGVIPEDWEVKKFEDIAEIVMGQSPIGSSYNQDEKGIALINGPTEFTSRYPIKKQWTTKPTKFCKENDILICVRGSSTGRMNISNDKYCIGRGVASLCAKQNYDNSLLQYLTNNAVNKILSLTTGSTFPNIDGKSLRNINVALPTTLKEQTAIATALSDTDALISGLEKLIAKKRNIKQGAMQRLLKPKDDWTKSKFGDLFIITAGGDLRKNEYSIEQDEKHQYPIYSNAITNEGLYGYCSYRDYNGNCITITARGGIGYAVARTSEFSAIGRLLILEPIGNTNCMFVAEYINLWINFANESTGVPQLTAPQISKYSVKLPDYSEQTRIAKTLSDMDTEITALETKLDKYKMIKQGMMQNLLTGKVRLI